MKIVISGSRTITDAKAVEFILRQYIACKDVVCMGDAKGVDAIAEVYARRYFNEVWVYRAEWDRYGKTAGPIRNGEMLKDADQLVAIWDGKSRGTRNAIDTALRRGIETHVHFLEGER